MSDAADHIVLYGSLCRGEPDFVRLGLGRRLAFVRPVRFAGTLYDLGDYPGVALGLGGGPVHGELYRILDPRVLDDLDAFEGYDPNDAAPYDPRSERGSLYLRRTITAEGARAFIYEFNPDGRAHPVVASGDWLAHKRGRAGNR